MWEKSEEAVTIPNTKLLVKIVFSNCKDLFDVSMSCTNCKSSSVFTIGL